MGLLAEYFVLVIILVTALCWVCFKLGQKKAWDSIAEDYIAIPKKCVVGHILVKREHNKKEKRHYEKRNKKNFSNRNGKKTFK